MSDGLVGRKARELCSPSTSDAPGVVAKRKQQIFHRVFFFDEDDRDVRNVLDMGQ